VRLCLNAILECQLDVLGQDAHVLLCQRASALLDLALTRKEVGFGSSLDTVVTRQVMQTSHYGEGFHH
jgi:hypothetical protein